MRILIHGINFSPELTGIGKYSGEMAQWLAAQGHEVRVVTAPPYYPQWRVAEGYSGARYKREFVTASPLTSSGQASARQSRELVPAAADCLDWIATSAAPPRNDGEGCHREAVGRGDPVDGNEVKSTGLPRRFAPRNDGEGWVTASDALPRNDGIVVFRCPLWVPAKPSGLKRILHLASFALSSFPVMLRQIFWRPDVVWVVEPALFCAPQAWLVARLSGGKAWLHVQDFEVDAAFDLGILKSSSLRRVVLALERWLMRRFDVVSTISDKMLERVVAKGVNEQRACLFPNWAEVKQEQGARSKEQGKAVGYRAELGIADDAVVALYSGNMGNKQGLEILAEAARLQLQGSRGKGQGKSDAVELEPCTLSLATEVIFVFCGNGSGRGDLEARCAGLPNVRFLELQPVERLGALLGMADIHLLPQRADAADLVMPSKLTGMLASGRPVVATAAPGTQVAMVVEQCGLVVPPGDAGALADAVLFLADDAGVRAELGAKARAYAEANLGRDAILSRFECGLRSLMKNCLIGQQDQLHK